MRHGLTVLALLLMPVSLPAQDRDTKVKNDRRAFEQSKDWIYNDLEEGIRAAKESGKPLMVVFRCIPCEACQEFDDDVARRDPVIRDMLDRYVCVRIVQANSIDLTHFQYDFDQSFAVVLANPDLTIYGRFGTRSERPEQDDISLEGLRAAMRAGLEVHAKYPANRASLEGKQPRPTQYKTPRDYPSLSGKYGPRINYEGQVAKSCIHCHQVREAERHVLRESGGPIPDAVLYPYPDPAVTGLKLDPAGMARVERVESGSPAEAAGLRVGDEIEALSGQPLLSIADFQWVLHNTPATTSTLPAVVRRAGAAGEVKVSLALADGWRRGNISWRPTTWDLRRMGFGGMKLEPLTAEERAAARLAPDSLGLKVIHVGQYGEHRGALDAGVRKGDILVAFDGLTRNLTESDLLRHALQQTRPGDKVSVTVLRARARKDLTLTLK